MTVRDETHLDRADFEKCFDDQPAITDPWLDLVRGRRAHRTRTHRRLAGAVAALTVAVAVSVTAPFGGVGRQLAVPAGPPNLVQPHWPGCSAAGAFEQSVVDGPPPRTGSVPSDFDAVQVRVCTQDSRRADNGDDVLVHVEREAPVTAALLAYLAQPSIAPPTAEPNHPGRHLCRAMLVTPPWLVLVDQDGRYMAPAFPTDDCGLPLQYDDPDGPAYALLDYHDVSVDQVGVLESMAARQAGCSMGHKNMLFFERAEPSPTDVDTNVFRDAPVRRCDYVVDRDDPEGGTFASGGPLAATELATLLAEAASAAPPRGRTDCATAASRFTVISSPKNNPTLYIETDGCRRVLEDK